MNREFFQQQDSGIQEDEFILLGTINLLQEYFEQKKVK